MMGWSRNAERAERTTARRGFDLAVLVVLLGAVVALLAVLGLHLAGYRAMVVRSGSMEPMLSAGDVAITKIVDAAEVGEGDVVTFRDPSREHRFVTHRVVERAVSDDGYAFVTRGDANDAVERWSIRPGGAVGRLAWRVPAVGLALIWVTFSQVRGPLMIGAALVLAVVALRWIWAPARADTPELGLDPG